MERRPRSPQKIFESSYAMAFFAFAMTRHANWITSRFAIVLSAALASLSFDQAGLPEAGADLARELSLGGTCNHLYHCNVRDRARKFIRRIQSPLKPPSLLKATTTRPRWRMASCQLVKPCDYQTYPMSEAANRAGLRPRPRPSSQRRQRSEGERHKGATWGWSFYPAFVVALARH